MKAVLLATAATLVLFLAATIVFRLWRTPYRARQLLYLYAGIAALLVLFWATLPADCGFLPSLLLVNPPWLDLLLALFFFSAAFFGGVLQLYNLADRGFSLRILIDALETPGGLISPDVLVAGYGGGQGIAWMYAKRLEGLRETGLADTADGRLVLTPKGEQLADRFVWLRRFLKRGPVP